MILKFFVKDSCLKFKDKVGLIKLIENRNLIFEKKYL